MACATPVRCRYRGTPRGRSVPKGKRGETPWLFQVAMRIGWLDFGSHAKTMQG